MSDEEYEKRFGEKERAARNRTGRSEPAGYQTWLLVERERMARIQKKGAA